MLGGKRGPTDAMNSIGLATSYKTVCHLCWLFISPAQFRAALTNFFIVARSSWSPLKVVLTSEGPTYPIDLWCSTIVGIADEWGAKSQGAYRATNCVQRVLFAPSLTGDSVVVGQKTAVFYRYWTTSAVLIDQIDLRFMLFAWFHFHNTT